MPCGDMYQSVTDAPVNLIFKMVAVVAILNVQHFKLLVAAWIGRASVRHHTKFHQNWLNGCGDFRFSRWQPSAIFGAYFGTTH